MPKKTLISFSLILTISLIVAFSISNAFAAAEFRYMKANVPQLGDQKLYADNEILVKFKDDSRVILTEETSVLSISRRGGFRRLRVPEGKSIDEMLEQYRADPNVEYAEPNYIYHAYMTPNDTYYSYQWHMPAINVEAGWDISTGNGVLVGIIDTGVAYENYSSYQQASDLAGTNFVAGYDFVNNDSHANDDNAHGTHVCGTIAQTTNNNQGCAGVAFNCTIMPIKVLDSGGSGYISDIADGIYYAADNGCQVINMSLGGSSGSTTLHNAVQYAHNAGVTIVCAAGNAGTSAPQYPASYEECISVSATRYDNTRPSYSSYGSTIDICAPGGDIGVDQNGDGYGDGVLQQTFAEGYPTDFGYYFYQGTSMASPHVAGTAAIVIAAGGGSMSPSEVRSILQSTATDLGASGWDQYYGYGKVNVYAAALAAQGGGNPPVANFVGSPTSGEAPLTVYFTDQSSNDPTSWDWDFGDGGTSTARNPNHQYTSAGTYTVSLTATNAYGSDTETKYNYITVTQPGQAPVAQFSGSPTSGEAPLTVYFTDQSSNNPTSWDWDFGDGGTSTAQNPSHQYTSAGSYTVALTAANAYGSDTETKYNYITVTQAGDWTVITYDDFEGGFGSYTDGGGDCALYTGGSYAHQGSNAADIQDNSGTASSFYHTGSYDVTGYGELEVEFWFYAVSMESGEDFWVQYFDGSTWRTVASYARGTDFNNNAFYNKVVPIPKGTYTYAANAKLRFMCDASGNSDDVYIDEIEFRGKSAGPVAPTADFVGDPTSGTAPLTVSFTDLSTGGPTSWSWTFGDGGTSTQQNPNHQYTSAGSYTVTLTATNAVGSDNEVKTNYITVTAPQPPVAAFSGTPTSGDAPLTVSFTDQSTNNPTSWSWTFGDGGTSTAQNPNHQYTSAGTYTVSLTATNAHGSDTETKNNYITVTEPSVDKMHVTSIYVSRQTWWVLARGTATVKIVDQYNAPVASATVYGNFTGPNSGSYSGATNTSGEVTFTTGYVWGPSGEWCFEVTNVTKGGWIYDSAANDVTKSCESGDVYQVSKEEMMASSSTPEVYELHQNFPNPFNPTTTIAFSLPEQGYVRLTIFNVAGELVETLVNREMESGIHTVTWNAVNVSSGVYFYRLQAKDFVQTKKMMLLR
jgi:serine protease